MDTHPYSDNENRKFTYEETENSVTITHRPEAIRLKFHKVSNPNHYTKISIIVNRGSLDQFPADLFDDTPFSPSSTEVDDRTSFVTTDTVALDSYTDLLPILKALATYAWVDNMNSLHIHNSDTEVTNHLVFVFGEI